MAAKKLKIGVLFGGRSGEHEVSLVSATSVIDSLNSKKYDIIPIGISKEGKWLAGKNTMKTLKEGFKVRKGNAIFSSEPGVGLIVNGRRQHLDVIFPVLHGTFGEDGTIQGLLEMSDIPFVGSGVLGSAVGMDKVIQKKLFEQANLPIVDYIWMTNVEWKKDKEKILKRVEGSFVYPLFVKPANLGSSVGISKVNSKKELLQSIDLAFQYDYKILIEQGVDSPREIECSVLGNDQLKTSLLGEVIPGNDFYDYNSKYVDEGAELIAPAEIDEKMANDIQKLSIKAFKALECSGMARVDFLISKHNKLYLNEVNTIPGFTSISMYPKLWKVSGLSYAKLLDQLVKLAIDRQSQRSQRVTSYQPKEDWYK